MAVGIELVNFTSNTTTVKITGMSVNYASKTVAFTLLDSNGDAYDLSLYTQEIPGAQSEVNVTLTLNDCDFGKSFHLIVATVTYFNSDGGFVADEETDELVFGGYEISISSTSITFTFNTDRAYYFRYYIRTPDYQLVADEWVGYHNPGYKVTYSGLNADTTYVCNAQYSLKDGSDGTWMGSREFTTPGVDWTVKSGGFIEDFPVDDRGRVRIRHTFNSKTVYLFVIKSPYSGELIIQCAGGFDVDDIQIFLAEEVPENITWGSENSDDFLVSGNKISYNIKKETDYYCWIRPTYGSASGEGYLIFTLPTEDEILSIDSWSWDTSNGNASSEQTSAAYNAISNKTDVSNFSYLVWNDMVDKVLEILEATVDSWDNTYASAANTKMSSSDKILTATRFNSLRQNIDAGSSTNIDKVSKGDPVYGSYFKTLAEHINIWINNLI